MDYLNLPPNIPYLGEPWLRDSNVLMSPPEYLADSFCLDYPYNGITLLTIHTIVVAKLINKRNSDAWWTVAYNHFSEHSFESGTIENVVFDIYDYIHRCLLTGFYIDPDKGVPVIAEFFLECIVADIPYLVYENFVEDNVTDQLINHSKYNSYEFDLRTVPRHLEFRRLYRMVMIYNSLGNNNTNLDEETQRLIFKGYHLPPHLWDDFKVSYLDDDKQIADVLEALPHGFDSALRTAHYSEVRDEMVEVLFNERDYYFNCDDLELNYLDSELSSKSEDYPEGYLNKMLELVLLQEVYPEFFDSDYERNYHHLLKYIYPNDIFESNYGLIRKDKSLAELIADVDIDYYHPLLNDETNKMSLAKRNAQIREQRENRTATGRTARVSSAARPTRDREISSELATVQKELQLSNSFVREIENVTKNRIDEMSWDDLTEYADGVTLELTILMEYLKTNDCNSHENPESDDSSDKPQGKKTMTNSIDARKQREQDKRNESRENYFLAFGRYPDEAPATSETVKPEEESDQGITIKVNNNNQLEPLKVPTEEPKRTRTMRTPTSSGRTSRVPATDRSESASERRAKRRRPDNSLSDLAKQLIPQATEELEDDSEDFNQPTDTVTIGGKTIQEVIDTVDDDIEEALIIKVDEMETPAEVKEEPVGDGRLLNRSMSLVEIADALKSRLLPSSSLLTFQQLPHHALTEEVDVDPDFEHKYYHCEMIDGKVYANVVVQYQEQWCATFFHNSRGSSILKTHTRMDLQVGHEMQTTGESEVYLYPWEEAKLILDPSFVKSTAQHVPVYDAHASKLYIYFDSYGKLFFFSRTKEAMELESYDKHQIDPEWVEAEMTHPDYDIASTTYRISPAATVNPLLDYDTETNDHIEPELKPEVLPSIMATDVRDAANRTKRLLDHRDLTRECQVAEVVWSKTTEVDADTDDAIEFQEWLTDWKAKPLDERKQQSPAELLMTIPLPRDARRHLVSHATEMYNELLKFNACTDVKITDIVRDWDNIENMVCAIEGATWIKPLASVNSTFQGMLFSYISRISTKTTEEDFGQFSAEVTRLEFTERNGLTMLPWTVQSMGLNLEDLRGGMVADGEDTNCDKLSKMLTSIVRRLAKCQVDNCQILTADGTIINIGTSMLKAKSYIIYTK